MKKIFSVCAAVAMMAACAKEVPQASVPSVLAPAENAEQMEVKFHSNVTASVLSKAQGGVDAWNGAQNLHIYGFQRQSGAVDYTAVEPFINNVLAASPDEGAADNGILVTDELGKPFYYVGNYTYDFYGYYVDDLVAVPQADADGVYLNLELTGGEDVMLAKAVPATDVQKAKDNDVFKGDATWKDGYAYSAYAARRGVQPSLTFKHQLVRFTFQITSGSVFEDGNPLYIKEIKMSARNSAKLYVAGNKTGWDDIDAGTADLSLCSLDGDQLVPMAAFEVPSADVNAQPVSVGESLMVIPNEASADDSYALSLVMEQAGTDITYPVDVKFSKVTNAVDGQTQFTAGYSYRVTIKVYGLEKVEISAELEPWVPGGDVSIDTDDAPEVVE
jgi:hypothetical protein